MVWNIISISNVEELLIDENELAKGSTNFDLSQFDIHKNQKIMSYGIDLDGDVGWVGRGYLWLGHPTNIFNI